MGGSVFGNGGGQQEVPVYIPPPPPPPAANPASIASGSVAQAGDVQRGVPRNTGKGSGFGGTDLTGGAAATGITSAPTLQGK